MADSKISSKKRRVSFTLIDVACHYQEEFSGDEFFLVSVASTSPDGGSNMKKLASPVIDMANGKSAPFTGDTKIYTDYVYVEDRLEIGVLFGEDDSLHSGMSGKVKSIADATLGAVASAWGAPGAFAAAVVSAAVDELASFLDPNDKLGSVSKVVWMDKLKPGKNGPFTWTFSNYKPDLVENNHNRYEHQPEVRTPAWEYTVKYQIDVGPEETPMPMWHDHDE